MCVSFLSLYLSLPSSPLSRLTVSVESESAYKPEELFPEAIKVMRGKIASIKAAAEALLADAQNLGPTQAVEGDGDVDMADS